MFITDEQSNYDRVFAELLETACDTSALTNAAMLGGRVESDIATVPLFGSDCKVTRDGVYRDGNKLDTIGSILTVRYLMQAGVESLQNLWLPYRDLRDGGQFARYIKAHLEDKTARLFSGKTEALKDRLESIGGRPCADEMRSDLAMVVHPLPRVPVLCLFWDRDEEFPASFQFLFDASAPSYLDLESLAATLQYICLKLGEDV